MSWINCPLCGERTSALLPNCSSCSGSIGSANESEKRTGLFGKISSLISDHKLKKDHVGRLRSLISAAVQDGKLTDDEMAAIGKFYEESKLGPKEFDVVRNLVFSDVVANYTRDRRITPEERESLMHIAERLDVPYSTMAVVQSQIDYFELLHSIETAPFDLLPATWSSSVILKPDEIDFFSVSTALLEERVVNRQIVGGSHGVSIRLMKGVSYRVGQSRGRIETQKGLVPISFGELTITNLRLVFNGDRKSVNAPYEKLQNIELFSDGLRFSLTSRQTPVTLQFYSQESLEIAGMYISRMLNQ